MTLHAGHKAGLIGANGAGKSSLFALLRGELSPDAGDCQLPGDWRIAHMRQEVDTLDRLAVDYVLDGDVRLRKVQAELAAAEQAHDGTALARLHSELESADGYTADARARKLLAGLGFTNEQMDRRVGDFSGGWRMRLNLAQALMCPSDLLLLDEPTNHLDLDAILWLEDWLKGYPGTLLLISHDRDFLDAVVDHVLHVEQRKLNLYKGGYTAFERTRAERLAQQQQAYEKQQAQRAHMEKYIARFKAQATKARQAQSRIKALERMEELSAAHVDSPFDFVFRESQKISSPLLSLSEGCLGYGDKAILDKVKLQLTPGARIGLLGPNGAGKSTTMRMVLGLDHTDSGTVRIDDKRLIDFPRPMRSVGALLDAGYLHPTRKAKEHLWALAASNGLPRKRVAHVLGLVGLADVANKRVGAFSLGMKQRLGLAAAMLGDPQTLVFDEPANGLDPEGILWMRNFLKGLANEGRTVFVSSHLLSEMALIADDLVVIGKGELIFQGPVDQFVDSAARKWVTVRSPQLDQIADALRTAGHEVVPAGAGAIDVVGPTAAEVGEVAAGLGATLHELSPQTASLEDVFLEVTAGAQEYRGFDDAAPPPPDAPPAPGGAS